MKDIGFILKNARENSGYTQKQVMALTGINSKSLSGYENNVAEPDLYTFARLAQLYGLSADSVLEIKTGENKTDHITREVQLLELFQKLDKTHQEELLVILDALIKHTKNKK